VFTTPALQAAHTPVLVVATKGDAAGARPLAEVRAALETTLCVACAARGVGASPPAAR
jgi:signal recognition particle receptor subunit beta